jgi:hypothetical protein
VTAETRNKRRSAVKKRVCRIVALVAIASAQATVVVALVALALIPLLAGCSTPGLLERQELPGCSNAKNSKEPRGFSEVNEELKTAPCGFKYKIIEIEGKRFVAYQTSHWYWEVTRLDD